MSDKLTMIGRYHRRYWHRAVKELRISIKCSRNDDLDGMIKHSELYVDYTRLADSLMKQYIALAERERSVYEA